MSATADAPLPQFHLNHSFPLYPPAPSIGDNVSACGISTNSAIQYQVPSPCRSHSSQSVSPAPSWDPAETRQSWGGYEWCSQEGTYAPASTPVYQYHNRTTTTNTYSFQPPRTNPSARSQPTEFHNIYQTPSFTQQPYIRTPNNSSPPLLPHHPIHPPNLPPLEHSTHLALHHSFKTFDLRPSLQFLASKTPPPEKPLSPPPTLVNSIPIDQRPMPPRIMSNSKIAKTDSAGPAAFACLSMDFGLSAAIPDPGTKSSAVSPPATCFASDQNPWESNSAVRNATAQGRNHSQHGVGGVSVNGFEVIFNDPFHPPSTMVPPPISLPCLSPTTPIKFRFAKHQQVELQFQPQPHLQPGIQLQHQAPLIPVSSRPITQPANRTKSSRPSFRTRSHSYPNQLGSLLLTSTEPMSHIPVHTDMASKRRERMNENGFATSGFNNPFHSSSTTTVVATSGPLHLSATVPDDFDMNEQPNEFELQSKCYSDQSDYRPLTTTEPMSPVPIADNLAQRAGCTSNGFRRKRSTNGRLSKANERGAKKRIRATLSGLKHFKRFTCSECGEGFTRKNDMDRHMQCKHSNELPFGCPVCSKAFGRKDKLDLHIERSEDCKRSAPPKEQRLVRHRRSSKRDMITAESCRIE
ncbi:hypothetical protein C348_02361 [Cryptococcus neoformans Gb118]|nr:hypothetical protein C350_02163 [Cryptococcus neoformans var. grubii MW-RSA36]OXL09326.1 hypothetical protein C348_02361 [Cryptococcus neoformans var. grubii Gb118]